MTVAVPAVANRRIAAFLHQLVRFGLVGASGALINFCVFFLSIKIVQVNPNAGAVLAFLVAVSSNYSLNRVWTFRSSRHERVPYANGWWRYVAINLLGFAVNLLVLNGALRLYGPDAVLVGQGLGLVAGMGFDFLLSRRLIFVRWAGRMGND